MITQEPTRLTTPPRGRKAARSGTVEKKILLRLTLGGAIWGILAGVFAGALCGGLVGLVRGDISLGLDGALVGSLVMGLGGAVYGTILGCTPPTSPTLPSHKGGLRTLEATEPADRGESSA